tara:strand:- start:608 stop:1417 length:810 start_codon:yes stop_codon:yes gene_type:complete
MKFNSKILIFTDLDGSLLNRETFDFGSIKNFLKDLLSKDIFIIPNSSKTAKEIINFSLELGEKLPYIAENGSAIHDLDLINPNFPEKITLSRELSEISEIFENKVPLSLKLKCNFLKDLKKKQQIEILGLPVNKIKYAINREYTIPFKFEGNKRQKEKLYKYVQSAGLSLQEGGRVINLCDKVSKSKAMRNVMKVFKKVENQKLTTIAVGDNFNDLEMLKNSDFPCLVFNDKFILEKININNCIVSKKPAPEGWEEIVKMTLDKIKQTD